MTRDAQAARPDDIRREVKAARLDGARREVRSAGPDDIRVGDAERDAVTTALHEHFAAGRLAREELDERLDAALAAKTHGDLREIVRDLPGPSGLRPAAEDASDPFPFHRRGHPAWERHHAEWRRHHPEWGGHRRPHGAFPLLLGAFLVVAFTAGPGAAILAVFHLALMVWIVRAVVLAIGVRRARPR